MLIFWPSSPPCILDIVDAVHVLDFRAGLNAVDKLDTEWYLLNPGSALSLPLNSGSTLHEIVYILVPAVHVEMEFSRVIVTLARIYRFTYRKDLP